MISPKDYTQFKELGLNNNEVDSQYNLLKNGVDFSQLIKPAILQDGIEKLSLSEFNKYAELYTELKETINILKFVPASGAATRMFKDLIEFLETKTENSRIQELFSSFDSLAFSALVPDSLGRAEKANYLLSTLKYQLTPKGLIPFHRYQGFTRTPFKEHWIEGLHYAASKGKVNVHFTVSAEHQQTFEQIYNTRITSFFEEYGHVLNITFSQQEKKTDTIIIDSKGEILKDDSLKPITRPGGHGALIQNLNKISESLVFIKNIDNVVHQNHLETTILYKKALAGKLLELRDKIFHQLKTIDQGEANLTTLELTGKKVKIQQPVSYKDWQDEEKIKFWKNKFNRPLRVCGMVKNEGEPGGGPFWVKDKNGISLQIVESAQINLTNKEQLSILQKSTHFNPVDLVCYLTDYLGNKFDLLDFIDESTPFITAKTVNGKEVKVLERPGLWNGAMADWITIFIEVPIETFNPVKTINDLLKPAHIA